MATAIRVSVVWGLGMLALFSFVLAREQAKRPAPVMAEHLAIAVVVIGLTRLLGGWVATLTAG